MFHFLPFATLSTEMIKKIKVLQQMSIFEHCVCLKLFEADVFIRNIRVYF